MIKDLTNYIASAFVPVMTNACVLGKGAMWSDKLNHLVLYHLVFTQSQ